MRFSQEFEQGFNEAIEWCKTHYKPFGPIVYPDWFQFRGDSRSRGYGEGIITGTNQVIDSAYPGNIGFSRNDNGSYTVFYPKGHLKNIRL